MPVSAYARRCLITLLLVAISAPLVFYGAWQSMRMGPNSPVDWVPKNFPARLDYDSFQQAFEAGDLAVVGWPGCTVDDERLEQFATALQASPQAADKQGQPHFERVLTGYHSLRLLMDEPLNVPRDEALRRLRGSLVGQDGESTCAVVVFTRAGADDRARAIELIRRVLEAECGIARDDQHLAGPIVDGHYVDVASSQSLRWFGPPSALIILLMTWWMLKSLRVALGVFVLALYCEILTLALVHFCGEKLSAILIVMPPLVLALAVAGGIHLVNYYFDALAEGEGPGVSRRALAIGWLPCTLSAGTTAIGLASLVANDIATIRSFGAFAAAGVTATLVLLLICIPGAFDLRLLPIHGSRHTCENHLAGETTSAAVLNWLNRIVDRYHTPIAVVAILSMVAAGWGLPRLQTSVKIRTLFSPQSRILRDYAWLEEHVAPLVPIEVVVRFDGDCPLSFRQRMELVGEVQRELANVDTVQGTTSAATFEPAMPLSSSIGDTARRAAIYRVLETNRQQFVDLKYLNETGGAQQWRVTARVSALNNVDYGHFLDDVRRKVEPLLARERAGGARGVSAVYTGIMPLVHEIQRKLMSGLFWSFLSALALITVVTMIVQRGVLTGLVVMIPNVFPMTLMFGLLGWWQVPIDIGSVMTASVALGMSIDGTLHFLTFFRRGLDQGHSLRTAVHDAYERCAAAMTESSLICGVGMLVFTFSSFVPSSRFAWMVFALLALALVGDLILLPALLLGPFGKLYCRRRVAEGGCP
jgi:predicted RND superfamily exporter protein